MMNILYLCTPTSIHDQKWFFNIATKEDANVYVLGEDADYLKDEKFIHSCKENKIKVLDPIHSFSIKRLRKSLKTAKEINQIINKYQIDLVHIMFATPYAFWGNFIKVPYVITTRGSDVLIVAPSLLNSTGIRRIHDRFLFLVLKRAFTKAKYITSTSQKQIEQIRTLFGINGTNLSLIRTGIAIKSIVDAGIDFLPASLKNKNIIFSPRYIQPIYNLKLQIETIKLLPDWIIKEYTFVFIQGEGKLTEYQIDVIEQLKEINHLDYVIFEKLSQPEMWSCYHAAKLTIMVPHSDGTPNSALEAMAARCPLIMGHLDYDNQLFNSETCIQLKENKVESLVTAIELALQNYTETLIDNALEKVANNVDLSNSVEKVVCIYKQILKD